MKIPFICHRIAKTALVCIMLFGTMFTVFPHAVNMPPDADASLPFIDVDPADWFYTQVRHVFEYDLMTGAGDRTFRPNMRVTRAMAVQVLYNHRGGPDVSWRQNPFTDVAEGAWYRDAVVWAAANGIVHGSGDGTFAPGDYITRAHLTVILNNYASFARLYLSSQRDSQPFADYMDIRNYAKEAIDRFFRAGIINGTPDGRFLPQGNATRAELAVMLSQFVRFSEHAPGDPSAPVYGVPCCCDDMPPVLPPYGSPPTPDYGFPAPEYGFPCLD